MIHQPGPRDRPLSVAIDSLFKVRVQIRESSRPGGQGRFANQPQLSKLPHDSAAVCNTVVLAQLREARYRLSRSRTSTDSLKIFLKIYGCLVPVSIRHGFRIEPGDNLVLDRVSEKVVATRIVMADEI